jgi:hypothetical protein
MTEIDLSGELASAFPVAVRDDVCRALSAFPATRLLGGSLSVQVGDEVVRLPGRIHNDPALIRFDQLAEVQTEFADCLLTRHSDGFVREKHLSRVICVNRIWVPPFVVERVGEYVVEILRIIQRNLRNLDTTIYGRFLRANPEFLGTIEPRVMSYWNCYYRDQKREDYVGFQLLEFFRSLQREK